MKLDPKEEKTLRALVEKDATDRPVFLTQEEGKTLFEEIDVLRQEKSAAIKHAERLVKKYADDTVSESIEEMLHDIYVMRNEINGLKDVLLTSSSMVQRATRIPCICDVRISHSSNVKILCEHCEILNHISEMVRKTEGK